MKKLFILTSLCMCMLMSLHTATAQVNAGDSDAKVVTILAVNDMHSTIDMFPKFAAIVDSVRGVHPNLLLFAAGDNRTGNPINDRHEEPGYPMVDLMNRVGFNASAIGNHEFDANIAAFRNLIGKSNFRYLCANIDAPDSMRLHTAPYRFFECNGVRIGVLGLIQLGPTGLPDTHPNNIIGINFSPAIETAKEYSWMREQCDVFILLTHLGYEDDLKLANEYPEADIIIGGHSHTVVPSRVLRNGTIITQTERKLKYVTELQVEVSGGKITDINHKLLNVNATKLRNDEIQAVVDKYNDNPTFKETLTVATTPFENAEELGCLMADAQRAETGSDIAIVNYGGVRYDTHAAGNFLLVDALSLDPFDNLLMTYDMTGEEVQQMIVASYKIGENPYVSGITYNVSFNADKSVKKVTVFLPDGKPINPKKKYSVAVNNYLSSVCPFTKAMTGKDTFIGATSALVDYLKKQPSISYQGVKRVIVN